MRDTKDFRGGIRGETFLAGPGCLYFRRRDVGCLKQINGGMRDGTHRKDFQKRLKTSFSKIFVVLVDKGSFVLVHGDNQFPLE